MRRRWFAVAILSAICTAILAAPAGTRHFVLLGDRTVTFPGWVRPALEALGDLPDLVPADLADLDPQSRVVLCRRLVREGLLEVVG